VGRFSAVALPPLYVEGLTQKARRGLLDLQIYKLGLVEALLKQTLRELEGDARQDVVADNVRTALEVTLWELRPPWRD
jgi:hypothetical protein